jgi:hypothetical protein
MITAAIDPATQSNGLTNLFRADLTAVMGSHGF